MERPTSREYGDIQREHLPVDTISDRAERTRRSREIELGTRWKDGGRDRRPIYRHTDG